MQKADGNGFGHIDVRALRFLACVLERRSVTRAGAAMGLSQPAASRLLAQLRWVLGDDPLLVRTSGGGGYVPTARAVELMPRLAEALAAAAPLIAPPAFDPAVTTRPRRGAARGYGAGLGLARLARDLATSAPGLSFDIRAWGADTLNDLEEGRLDFALYTDAPLPACFRYQKLFEERYACVVRHDHPVLAHRDADGRVAPTRLAELPRVLLRYPNGSETAVDDPLAPFGVPRAGAAFRTPYFLSGPLLVGSSDHVLCTARRVAELVASMAKVRVIEFPEAGRFTYCLIWHERAEADPGLVWIRERVVASSG